MSDNRINRKRKIKGIVTSDKMDKTIVVKVGRRFRHPVYGKTLKRFKKYKAHDEKNIAKIGQRVEIEETRPISKDKRWRLLSILSSVSQPAEDTTKS